MTQIVSVTVPGAALYVSGTVNGEATVWTNTEGYTWETTAPKAVNDTYLVELTIIDDFGQSSTATLTLYYGVLSLITDRTSADKRRAEQLNKKGWAAMSDEEKAFYLSAQNKGTYKALDMNRVNGAVEYLVDRLNDAGITVEVAPKINWQDSDKPTPAQLSEYLQNVEALRAAITQLPTTPNAPEDMDGLTIEEANNIEIILLALNDALNRLQLTFWYCNEIYSGEV